MLSCVFIGSKNDFDDNLIHWLSKRTNMVAVVSPTSSTWRYSASSRFNFVKKRIKKYGLIKAVDEILFWFYYDIFKEKKTYRAFEDEVIFPYRDADFKKWEGPNFLSDNLNDKLTTDFIASCKPDIIFAMCINDYFGSNLLNIPKLGVFLWHEGITPEYRGLYSPFWAIHNLDFNNIGYTLLRMNQKIDGGEIFVQGKAKDVNPFKQTHSYIGHKAIWDSLEEVEQFLINLENGNARSVDREKAVDNYYSYPGLSDYIRMQCRLKKLRINRTNPFSINR